MTGRQRSRQAAAARGGRAGYASAKARGQEKKRKNSEKVDSERERGGVTCDLSQTELESSLSLLLCGPLREEDVNESGREERRRLREKRENAVRDDVQEELPAAAASAGWKRGAAEGPFQPQEAQLVQELQGAPAGAEDRGGRVARRAKSPASSASPSLSPSWSKPPEAGDVPAAC